jgi:hypothetical protein
MLTLVLLFGIGTEAWLLYTSPEDTPPQRQIISIAVDARKEWQDTSIAVQSGDQIVIQVIGGAWTNWRDRLPDASWEQIPASIKQEQIEEIWFYRSKETDGNGYTPLCKELHTPADVCPIQNYNIGALIAQIDTTTYGIGQGCSFTATDTGMLRLRMNDSIHSDNGGMLAVVVTIGQSVPNLNSQPCGEPVT